MEALILKLYTEVIMTPDEANALMQVMSEKVSQLTRENMLFESKIIYLTQQLKKFEDDKSSEILEPDGKSK